MTTMTHEEALAHFGVKGMHWGQRKAESSGSGGSGGSAKKAKPAKPTRNDILTARAMRDHLADKSWDINDKLVAATTDKGRAAAVREMQANDKAFDKAHDVAKLSTGREKVAAVLGWATLITISVGSLALGATAENRRL